MGYGQQQGWAGPPPGPGSGKKTNPLVPILIVLVLVAGGVGAYLLLSGDDEEGGGGGGPAAAAERYTEAFIDGDCGAIIDAMSIDTATAETFSSTCETMLASDGEVTESFPAELIGTTVDSEDATTATVTVDYRTRGGSDDSETFDLVNEGGTWLVTAESAGVIGADGGSDDSGSDDTSSDDTSSDDTGSDDTGGGSSSAGEPTSPPLDDPEAANNPELAGYAQSCYDGDMAACDDLWRGTEIGGTLEAYAESCGGRLPEASASGDCETLVG